MRTRDLKAMARRVAKWDWTDHPDEKICIGCGEHYSVEYGLDPSALCHACAQTYVVEFARLLAKPVTVHNCQSPAVMSAESSAAIEDYVDAAYDRKA